MNRRIACLASVIAAALAFVGTPSCAVMDSEPPTQASAPELSPKGSAEGALVWAASWSLSWDTQRITPERSGGWSVETDLGYVVHLERGWFVDHIMSFGPCDAGSAAGAGGSGAGGGTSASLPFFRLGIREARAHDDADPSAIEAMYAEDLTRPAEAGPWSTTFAAKPYCRALWLVARATATLDAPPGVAPSLDGKSLYLTGTWKRGAESRRFTVDTWWPGGHLRELADVIDPDELAAANADGRPFAARARVERDLGALFDGIDFETASQEVIDGLTIENLAAHATMSVELFRPDQ